MKTILLATAFFISISTLPAQDSRGVNYDESKVPLYNLPDVLLTSKNKKVKNTKDWENVRRPEILHLFEENVYGRMPKKFDSIRYSIGHEDRNSMNGKAWLKEILIEVFNTNESVKINLVLFIPNNVQKPAPAFLLINNRGKEHMDASRIQKSAFWPAETLIDSGYAIAAFQVNDLAPDKKEEFMHGLLRLYPEQLTTPNGMRAMGAWAWGASRVMDYFETDQSIDATKVAVVGHSRGGKASLWAAAQDQRFTMCISNCSGSTGAVLARRQFGERIRMINNNFPHWFNQNYKKYNDKENELPVDQHMLVSLIAPRPVYATSATLDLWADPKGTYLSLKNAEKAFDLYGLKSALTESPPAVNQAIIESPLAYHNREGKHDLTLFDWLNFIQFANYHYKR